MTTWSRRRWSLTVSWRPGLNSAQRPRWVTYLHQQSFSWVCSSGSGCWMRIQILEGKKWLIRGKTRPASTGSVVLDPDSRCESRSRRKMTHYKRKKWRKSCLKELDALPRGWLVSPGTWKSCMEAQEKIYISFLKKKNWIFLLPVFSHQKSWSGSGTGSRFTKEPGFESGSGFSE